MCSYIKRLTIVLCSCLMWVGCTPDRIFELLPSPTPTYRCYWPGHIAAHLINAELDIPNSGCSPAFINNDIAYIFPSQSFYDVMESGLFYDESYWQLTWDVSVYDKTCESDEFSHATQRMVLTQSDIGSRFCYGDVIEESPLIDTLQNVLVDDIKHQLTFQLFKVVNQDDHSVGTITWTKTWKGQDSSMFIPSHNTWEFYFPTTAMIGTYYSTEQGYTRYIYVYNQFEYH